jgi:hypothetical protein
MRRNKNVGRAPKLRTGPSPEEDAEHGRITVRLYVPANLGSMDKETRKSFDNLRKIVERMPEEWYSTRIVVEREGGEPGDLVMVFGGMRCYDINNTLSSMRGLMNVPSYHLRE